MLWSYYGRDKEIIIPEGVTAIGTEAFYRNCYIKELIIPESVAFIGQGAFRGCSAMKKLVIPQSVKCVDNKAFYGCYKLGDSDGFLIINNVLYGYYGKSTKITIPEGATVIGEDSFYNRIMDNVTVPEGVISIGRYAFQNANIGSVTLPQSVTSIGERAFGWGSTSLVVKAGSYAEQYAKENNIPFVAEE